MTEAFHLGTAKITAGDLEHGAVFPRIAGRRQAPYIDAAQAVRSGVAATLSTKATRNDRPTARPCATAQPLTAIAAPARHAAMMHMSHCLEVGPAIDQPVPRNNLFGPVSAVDA